MTPSEARALGRTLVDRAGEGPPDPAWMAELRALVGPGSGDGVGRAARDDVLRAVLEEATRRLGAERGTLYTLDPRTGAATSRVAEPALRGGVITLLPGEGVAGWVARTGETLRTGRSDARFSPRIDATTGFVTRTLLAAPVRCDGAIVGVLQLLNHEAGGFRPRDERRLAAIAVQVGALLGPREGGPLAGLAGRVVGDSPALLAALDRARRAAPTDATVLLRGESGTGKELVARALHAASRRAGGPFVVVDCAALPPNLVENELFGHARGAFTGADRAQEGRVHAAEGGTLFLDEIGELPPAVQGRLLRLLQERTFYRVGGDRPERADVRFVAATWRDLEGEVAAGRFRADLYWRLRVVEVRLPSLADRGPAEVDRLVDHFLAAYGARYGRDVRLTPAAREALRRRSWPGNVRELEHCVEAAVALCEGGVVGPELLFGGVPAEAPPASRASAADAGVAAGRLPPSSPTLAEVERAYIGEVLTRCGGNRTVAARELGIGRNTLGRKLRG